MIVVFSGYNQRAVITFLRTMRKNNINNYVIIASGYEDTIFDTYYRKDVTYIRKKKELNLEEILTVLKEINHLKEKLLIAPTTEALNRFLLNNRKIFEDNYCIVPLVEKNLYELISDKESFRKICAENGFCVPKIFKLPDRFILPFVAKPKKYISSNGEKYDPIIIKSKRELEILKKEYPIEEFEYQEFITGESYYILFYFSIHGECYMLSQQNLAQQPNGKSIVAAIISNIYMEEIAKRYKDFFQKQMFFYGFLMIELRRNNINDYMIEANPRFWGPSQLFYNAGYNFFEFFLKDYGYLQEVQEKEIDFKAKYLWSGGISGKLIENDNCIWYIGGKSMVEKELDLFLKSDIYKEEDTYKIYENEKSDVMNNREEKVKKLNELYNRTSKHSNYQMLPNILKKILPDINVKSRWEEQRWSYINSKIDMNGKKLLDIGGNTGYFSFSAIENGACVDYYEGNENHAEFVKLAMEVLNIKDKIFIHSEYFLFEPMEIHYDIVLCLNVIHHLGEDFIKMKDMQKAKEKMSQCIKVLLQISDIVVLQLGYNWCGNNDSCLFEHGTKYDMENFVMKSIENYGEIISIGIAQFNVDSIEYVDLTSQNNLRQDELGEFLNRPLFIIKSLYTK